MTGYTPEQVPVLNGIAREFGVFDHWFCEVPSQTFMNRSFWTAATSSGFGVNFPVEEMVHEERRRDDLRTTRSGTARPGRSTSWSRCRSRTPASSTTRGRRIASPRRSCPSPSSRRTPPAGPCPTSRWIEPNLWAGHGDYHPAMRSVVGPGVDVASSTRPPRFLAGEAFLERLFNTYRSATSASGTNVWNTALLIGWDEPGGTYDHVPPGTGSAARPVRARGRVRLHVRPLRLPSPRDPRLAVGRAGLGLQRGVPSHVTHRDVAEGVGSRRGVHATRRRGAHLRSRVHPRRGTRSQTSGPPSLPGPFLNGRWTRRSWARPSAAWERRWTRPDREGQGVGRQTPAATRRPQRRTHGRTHGRGLRDVCWHFFPGLVPAGVAR